MKDSKHVVILDMVFIICENVIPKHCAIKIMHAPFHCAFHLLRKFNTKPLSTVKACTPKKKHIENGKKKTNSWCPIFTPNWRWVKHPLNFQLWRY